jgi:tetratricopeptide (TPR) repeat protein
MRIGGTHLQALGVTSLLILIIMGSGCPKDGDQARADKEAREQEAFLTRKIEEGSKLSRVEIGSLSAILLLRNDYDKGIQVLQRLKKDDRYSREMDDLYFGLSLFYFEKARVDVDERKREELMKQAAQYLSDGFGSAQDKAMAFYKRAKAYSALGCFEKAIGDSRNAIRAANTQSLIDFGDGFFLDSKEFIKIVNAEIGRFEKLPENCRIR